MTQITAVDETPLMGPHARAWVNAIAESSAPPFASVTSPDVVLEGSVFVRPIRGVRDVSTALRAAGDIYDSLAFTYEGAVRLRTYLEWEAVALGLSLSGVTVLLKDNDGLIVKVAIHHRPLTAVESFSEEIRYRLEKDIGGGCLAADSRG
jgi:hypothetical protein